MAFLLSHPTSSGPVKLDGLSPYRAVQNLTGPHLLFPSQVLELPSALIWVVPQPPDHFLHFRSCLLVLCSAHSSWNGRANLIQSVLCSKPSTGLAPAFPSGGALPPTCKASPALLSRSQLTGHFVRELFPDLPSDYFPGPWSLYHPILFHVLPSIHCWTLGYFSY